jgi:hypothetical protein
VKTRHKTYGAMNSQVMILGVEDRYLLFTGGVLIACLLSFGIATPTVICPVSVWAIGLALYTWNPQWLSVLLLKGQSRNRHSRYDARHR